MLLDTDLKMPGDGWLCMTKVEFKYQKVLIRKMRIV